jgi:hypothetical protein
VWSTRHLGQDTILCCCAARTAAMDVEAFIVNIEHPADTDEAGLVNPLLHCYQICIFNVNVWALPAVQARSPQPFLRAP